MTGERPLRVLMLEDRAADAELMARALRGAGVTFEHRRVATRQEFMQALGDYAPDVILADYSLPDFDAVTALGLARKVGPPVPFLVVTGRLDAETAVACAQAGADDYVLKDHLVRLPIAVRVALDCHQARTARRRAEEAYVAAIENSLQGLAVFRPDRLALVNQSFADIVGWSVEELCAMDFPRVQQLVHPDDYDLVWGRFRDRSAGKLVTQHYEFRVVRRDGTVRWLEMYASNVLHEGEPAVQAAVVDVTERHRVESELRASHNLLRDVLDSIPVPVFWKDADSRYLGGNRLFVELVGVQRPESLTGRQDADLCWTAEQAAWLAECDRAAAAAAGESAFAGSLRFADGTDRPVRLVMTTLRAHEGGRGGVLGRLEVPPPS